MRYLTILKTCVAATLITLSACGGGSSSNRNGDSLTPDPTLGSSDTVPAGLYVGYYAESPTDNPEDPTFGAATFKLPDGNATFGGSMYFTYVGCQDESVGLVSGTKSAGALNATWSGFVDGTSQSGDITGSYLVESKVYQGTYTVHGGKQLIDRSPCARYYIASRGAFELLKEGDTLPSSFGVTVTSSSISWSAVSAATYALIYILDPAKLDAGLNPVIWQVIVAASTGTVTIPSGLPLASGSSYVAVVALSTGASERAAIGSTRFTR